jgi:hypothetical protein
VTGRDKESLTRFGSPLERGAKPVVHLETFATMASKGSEDRLAVSTVATWGVAGDPSGQNRETLPSPGGPRAVECTWTCTCIRGGYRIVAVPDPSGGHGRVPFRCPPTSGYAAALVRPRNPRIEVWEGSCVRVQASHQGGGNEPWLT